MSDVLAHITVTGLEQLTQTVLATFSYPIFTDKGLVLNFESFQGDVLIQDSTFQQNMYNVPGLAYVP